MRLRTNILFVAATVLAYLSQAPTTREPLNSHWGAVFPPASAGQLLRQCSRTPTPIQGTWNPSPDQVRLLEGPLSVLRSEEHTSELQSHSDLVCRLLLEKKKKKKKKQKDIKNIHINNE